MTIKDKLTKYISHELLTRETDVAPDDELLLSGLVDSIGVMTLLLFIEEDFGIHVPPEDVTIENFASIRTIDAYLIRRTNGVSHA
ncbi:MAG: acyl carrier protein [Rhodothermales bacterium]|nr:acyl carrier protein [Rhodothermales bacterium]